MSDVEKETQIDNLEKIKSIVEADDKKIFQIDLLKKLKSKVENFQKSFEDFHTEWTHIKEDIKYNIWSKEEEDLIPLLNNLEDYDYVIDDLDYQLFQFLNDFKNSPLLN